MVLIIKRTGIEDYLDGGEARIKCLIMGQPDAGKGHPLTTELLTPDGYVPLGKLQVGDAVIGSNGRPASILAIHERGVLPLKRVFFNDGTSVLVDSEHLWQVRDHHGQWQVVETNLLGTLTRRVGDEEVLKWEIPRVSPVQYVQAQLPLHPYVLGALLANGYLGTDHVQLTVAFGVEWEDHIEAIEKLTPRWMAVREVTRKRDATARQFHLHQCLGILRELGLAGLTSGAKFIPKIYLQGSEEQRRNLLAGLMDTDGGVRGSWPWYYSTSSRLADDVADLVRSLGGYAVVKVVPRDNKPTEFNVKIGMESSPFRLGPKPARWRPAQRLARRISSIEDAGFDEVRCIEVEAADHLYVTEHHIVTHNTRSASFWPRPIFADCEEGRMSIADRQVPYGAIKESADLLTMIREVSLLCKGKSYTEQPYQTFVLDTIDAYQKICIRERLDSTGKESLSGWADWGYLDAKMVQVVERLLALPMNIVVNMHVKEFKIGEGDDAYFVELPRLKGDVKDWIAGEFDLIGYMGTMWESNGNERVQGRGIQWEATPLRPILRDRGGSLPKWTRVTFSEEDYSNLFLPLIAKLDDLKPSEVVAEWETEVAKPVPPQVGGPVSGPVPDKSEADKPEAAKPKAAAKKAVAGPRPVAGIPVATKPATAGADPVPASPPPPAPEPVAEVPAESPAPAAEPTAEEAVATVQAELGGEVISPVESGEGASTENATAAGQDLAEPTGEAPPVEAADGTGSGPSCGDVVNPDEPPDNPVPGCGKPLGDTQEAQIALGHNPMLLEIARIKSLTHLCSACWANHKAKVTAAS